MGKRYKVFYLNGPNKGKDIEIEAPYTAEQEAEAKCKKRFMVDGVLYDGWCRKCGQPVRYGDSMIDTNVDGLGHLVIDVFHKYCY